MARSCKYGKLKTPSRKGKTVRKCRRRPKSKKCSKKVCKYGKLKTPKRSRKGTRCCKRKPKVPESIHNAINTYIELLRKEKSLQKRIDSLNSSISSESNEVRKLQKQIKLVKLNNKAAKLKEAQAKNDATLERRINTFKAKGAHQSKAVDIAVTSMNKRVSSI
tara:strand:+ start:1859 stop:2347 length:489 start_codon:yes stop_codon:yes gene_type:complete